MQIDFWGFFKKLEKIMLTNFSKFSKKMKVYGNDGLTMTFLANLQKTFHFWTFLKCLIFHMPEPIQNI
jgi:hypothetical protein